MAGHNRTDLFQSIDYLQSGNEKQKRAYEVLKNHRVMEILAAFDPILVGTIPIQIDIETSDLDIICCYSNKETFVDLLRKSFGDQRKFDLRAPEETDRVVCSFWLDDFELEIFGQPIPSKDQNGYRHMIIEHQLLCERGETFRQEIIALKKQGYKTEPAFGIALGLKGDPYRELLNFERKNKKTL